MWSTRGVTVFTAALFVSACASSREFGGDGQPVYGLGEVEARPSLLGCRNYTPVPPVQNVRGRYITSVRVSLVVNPEGAVEPQSLRYRGASNRQAEAESLARGCFYTPAELRGAFVYVRTTQVFRLQNLYIRTNTLPLPPGVSLPAPP